MENLAYFLTAAECGNFSEAAQKLYVSQPQVSKRIRGLEKELGVTLFRRAAYGVVLTDEGRFLYGEWKALYERFQQSMATVRAISSGYKHILRIGCYRVFGESGELQAAVEAFESACPDVQISIELYEFAELREKMLNGEVDVAFTYDFNFDDALDISMHQLHRLYQCIALPARHRLANEKTLKLSDLSGETLLLIQTGETKGGSDRAQEVCRREGCVPGRVLYIPNVSSMASAISRGLGFTLIGTYIAEGHENTIRTFPMPENAIPSWLVLAWRKDHLSDEIRTLRDLLTSPHGKNV